MPCIKVKKHKRSNELWYLIYIYSIPSAKDLLLPVKSMVTGQVSLHICCGLLHNLHDWSGKSSKGMRLVRTAGDPGICKRGAHSSGLVTAHTGTLPGNQRSGAQAVSTFSLSPSVILSIQNCKPVSNAHKSTGNSTSRMFAFTFRFLKRKKRKRKREERVGVMLRS